MKRIKLKEVTFTLQDSASVSTLPKPIKSLLWCDKVPKGKRNKPAKVNGVQHHEIVDNAVVHQYYQPVQ